GEVAVPELCLADRGEGPGRVDMEDVTVCDWSRLAQIELNPVLPPRAEALQVAELWIEREDSATQKRRGRTCGERADEPVSVESHVAPAEEGVGCRDAVVRELERLNLGTEVKLDTAAFQQRNPGVDEYGVGGAVEHSVEAAVAAPGHVVVDPGLPQQPDRPGACLARVGGKGEMSPTLHQQALVVLRETTGSDEVPPIGAVPLAQAPRVAT